MTWIWFLPSCRWWWQMCIITGFTKCFLLVNRWLKFLTGMTFLCKLQLLFCDLSTLLSINQRQLTKINFKSYMVGNELPGVLFCKHCFTPWSYLFWSLHNTLHTGMKFAFLYGNKTIHLWSILKESPNLLTQSH